MQIVFYFKLVAYYCYLLIGVTKVGVLYHKVATRLASGLQEGVLVPWAWGLRYIRLLCGWERCIKANTLCEHSSPGREGSWHRRTFRMQKASDCLLPKNVALRKQVYSSVLNVNMYLSRFFSQMGGNCLRTQWQPGGADHCRRLAQTSLRSIPSDCDTGPCVLLCIYLTVSWLGEERNCYLHTWP